jgi:two-component system sensor histidine kinase TctE
MADSVRRGSIRRRLLLFLIPSLLLLVVGAAALTYHVALRVATSAYDRSLLDPALDIAANIRDDAGGPHLAMQAQAQQALLYDHEDEVVFQARDASGAVIVGNAMLIAPPNLAPGQRAFFDSRYNGEPVRVAAVRSDSGLYVQVAETLHKRNRLGAAGAPHRRRDARTRMDGRRTRTRSACIDPDTNPRSHAARPATAG